MKSESNKTHTITTFLFDLGNVILFFDQNIFLQRIAKYTSLPLEKIKSDATIISLLNDYEMGKFSSHGFFNLLKESGMITDHALTFESFVPMWSDIFWKNAQMVNFISKLKGQYKLGMISNTNEMHISFAKKHFPDVFALFDVCIFSHEVGLMKPEKEIYRKTLDDLNSNPEECMYVDDVMLNVEGAKNLGIESIHYVSMQGLLDILRYKYSLAGF